MDGYLCETCQEHFAVLRTLLESMGIRALHNPHIVRGLDYYTRTVFEISSTALGAQNSVSRRRTLRRSREIDGRPADAGVGLAMGMDRMLMLARSAGMAQAHEGRNGRPRVDVVFVALDEPSAHTLVPVMERGAGTPYLGGHGLHATEHRQAARAPPARAVPVML